MIQWWFYLVAIPAAFLLVNGIPHFTQGIAGKQFHTPFVGGPPQLDNAVKNVIWVAATSLSAAFCSGSSRRGWVIGCWWPH